MNKYLLGTAAIAGLLLASAPAQAQMELTIGGHSKNYVGYLDQDNTENSDVDMIRETELHFNGESTLDNGLTFGFQVEAEVDDADDDNTIEESYIYMSGTWGRVNLGSEDGAAYLLQVAAPSADSNIDGIRQYINPTAGLPSIDYAQDATGTSEKITYLSPNYNGLQFGGSLTHDVDDVAADSGFNVDADNSNDLGYDVAARYEGVMSNFGYAFGAGYTEVENASDNFEQWNVGLDVDSGPFGIGASYGEAEDDGADADTLVVGVDYTSGPFKFGASYLNTDGDAGAVSAEADRYTGGVVYTAGPGLTFRGSVSQLEVDTTGGDLDATSVMGGIQINF